ncbi:MAG: DPP IV N-terminal domain-containing protein [Pirellulales bacterium]
MSTINLPFKYAVLWCVALSLVACRAQGADPDFLEQYGATYRFTLGQPTAIRITDAGDAVLFLRSGPRSFERDLYEFDVATGKERLLVSADELLQGAEEQLTAEERARRERMRLAGSGIVSFDVSSDGEQILVPLSGSLYLRDRKSGKFRELSSAAGYPIDARYSPDGKSVACVREGDLYLIDLATGDERRLTNGASDTLTHGLAEFVAQEEMDRMRGYWWSPDSNQIAYQETDTSGVEELHIADPANPASAPQAWRYPRPGKNNASVRLGIIPATGGATTWIEWDRERYPYLAKVTWEENAPLTLLVQNREQTEEVLLAVEPSSGGTRELLNETDAAWINIDAAMPHWLADGKSFLWSTERDGGWQLELRDRDGKRLSTLTPREMNYRSFVGVESTQDSAIVAGGKDPTQVQLYRVSLQPDGPEPEQLTSEAGLHSAVLADKSGTNVRITTPAAGAPRFQVHRGDATSAGDLVSVAEAPPFAPNIEFTVVGEPPLHAAIIRPRAFDAARRYPVIVSVYGGPHAQVVMADHRRYLLNQWLADQGFIVVAIDGRGTPSRGREWERSIKGNLIELPLADQVRGLQALGEKYHEMDLSRVGIYGWSFGGYFSALAVMQRPDVFHAGVAGAPVVDWLDYDTHYTERYLGLPSKNEAGYRASSVLTHAPTLDRPLLVIHGTADDNVYFLHSMKLCDALFRAGRPYDFLPLSGLTHMVPDPLVTKRLYGRIANFFVEQLETGAKDSTSGDMGGTP